MKKIVALLIALGLVFSFAACNDDSGDEKDDKEKVEDIQDNDDDKDSDEDKDSDDDKDSDNDKDSDKDKYKPSSDEEKTTEEKPTEPQFSVNPADKTALIEDEIVTIEDVCEFSLDYFNITDDVMPPTPSSYYSHYPADEGKTYVDVCILYKNLETSAKNADEILRGTLYYADYYEYPGFSTIEEDNRGDFTYTNITSIDPLTTEYLHYLFLVPDEVTEGTGNIFITLEIAEKEYGLNVKDGEKGKIAVKNPDAVAKTKGSVVSEEVIIIEDNAEFFVEFSNITEKVTPPYPADYYSYYEADEGKAYVEVCFFYKNLTSMPADADKVIKATLKYDDKYDYKGFSTIEEESRGDFTYTSITSVKPLNEDYIHYLFEVPTEVSEGEGSIVVNFTVAGNDYSYTVR